MPKSHAKDSSPRTDLQRPAVRELVEKMLREMNERDLKWFARRVEQELLARGYKPDLRWESPSGIEVQRAVPGGATTAVGTGGRPADPRIAPSAVPPKARSGDRAALSSNRAGFPPCAGDNRPRPRPRR